MEYEKELTDNLPHFHEKIKRVRVSRLVTTSDFRHRIKMRYNRDISPHQYACLSPMKKILLATRPLVPPWDEASKNFAYFLAKSMESHHVSILTTPTWLPDLPANVTQIPCYTKNELDFSEKLRLLSALRGLRNKFDITHYLFTTSAFTLYSSIRSTFFSA